MAKKKKRVNASPLSAREGKVYIDGTLVADSCKFRINFKPTVWAGRSLGKKGTSRRWIGYDIELTLDEWKTNRFYKEKIDEYIQSGKTPEFKIQGIQNDPNSDFYDNCGKEKVTCIGCVPTGDIDLMDCDTDGEVVKISTTFGAYDLA